MMRIKRLTLADFRAFPGLTEQHFDLEGKNLLLYGENGAGKSSIFHALNAFFSLNPGRNFRDHKNVFSGQPDTSFSVGVEFEASSATVQWTSARHPAFRTAAQPPDQRVIEVARRKACLDYRGLLETNFRHGAGPINLFDITVRHLLADFEVPASGGTPKQISELWADIEKAKPRRQTTDELNKVNTACSAFNQGLRSALSRLEPLVGEILNELLNNQDILVESFEFGGVTYHPARLCRDRIIAGQTLTPKLKFRNHPLDVPQAFLNEARLSALALALYFAGRLTCVPSGPGSVLKLMVLDDVLIGLDQSNRYPVLQALGKHFADWQIVLLTHDRVWFEMAQFHLESRDDWVAQELYEAVDSAGVSRPVVRHANVDPVVSNLNLAREFHTKHHFPAAAVHARIAFEQSLKKICERKAIPVRFRSDQRKLTTDELLGGIEEWLSVPKRITYKDALADPIKNVKLSRHVVLNAFSHSTPVNLASSEALAAIDAVQILHETFKSAVK